MKMVRWLRAMALIAVSVFLCACKQDQLTFELQMETVEKIPFLEGQTSVCRSGCDSGFYLFHLGREKNEEGSVLSLAKCLGNNIEILNQIETDAGLLIGEYADAEKGFYVFKYYADQVKCFEFDKKGKFVKETLVKSYECWRDQHAAIIPQIQMFSNGLVCFVEEAENNKKNGIAIWGCECKEAEVKWGIFLEQAHLQYVVNYGEELLIIYKRSQIDKEQQIISLINQNGEERVLWVGENREVFKGIVVLGVDGKNVSISDLEGLYQFDVTERTCKRLVSWEEVDYRGNPLAISPSRDAILEWIDENDKGFRYCQLNQAEKDNTKEKIVIAGLEVDASLKAAVSRYNLKQTEYRIEIVDYCQNGAVDIQDARKKLYADFIKGEQIDLLYTKNVNVKMLGKNGYLKDLYSFMTDGNEIDKGDFVKEVLDAMEQDGKLFYLFPDFVLGALAVNEELAISKTNLSLNEYICEMGGRKQFNVNLDLKDFNFLQSLFLVNYAQCFEADETKFRLHEEEIEKILQCAKLSCPINGAGVLEEIQIGNLYLLQAYSETEKSGKLITGYPSDSGKGVRIIPDQTTWQLAISKNAKYDKEAWKFISWLMSEDYRITSNTFPVLADKLEEKMNEEQTAYVDEITGEKNWKMILEIQGQNVYCYAASDKEREIFYNLLRQGVMDNLLEDEIWNIISEETQVFFEGNRDLKVTVDVMKKRLQLLFDERVY